MLITSFLDVLCSIMGATLCSEPHSQPVAGLERMCHIQHQQCCRDQLIYQCVQRSSGFPPFALRLVPQPYLLLGSPSSAERVYWSFNILKQPYSSTSSNPILDFSTGTTNASFSAPAGGPCALVRTFSVRLTGSDLNPQL